MQATHCVTCRFYQASDDALLDGLCRRRPPVVMARRVTPVSDDPDREPYRDDVETHWPEVEERDWCGEHEPPPDQ